MKPVEPTPPPAPNTDVAAPLFPVQLGGKTYMLSHPADSDTASIALEMRRHIASPIARLVDDPAFAKLPTALQAVAVEKAAAAQVSGVTLQQMQDGLAVQQSEALAKPDFLAFVVWVTARRQHAGLTIEEIRPQITEANTPALIFALGEVLRDPLERRPTGQTGFPPGQIGQNELSSTGT